MCVDCQLFYNKPCLKRCKVLQNLLLQKTLPLQLAKCYKNRYNDYIMINLNQIWSNILLETETKVSTVAYDLYISSLEPVGVTHNRLVLLAPTRAICNIDNEKGYKQIIKNATLLVFPSIEDVEIITENDLPSLEGVAKEVDIPVTQKYDASADEEKTSFVQNYTFDNFVVGKSNEFAKAVSLAVAENPGVKYNPVFLWGGVGLGKTHLVHAIGNYLQRNHPEKKVKYVSSEKFMNEFVDAVRNSSSQDAIKNFRNRYRSVDVFMMDDVQLLAKGESTQEEMFHTFNELFLADKQIILTSDRPPKEINIEDRLKTRFETGVIADIQPPDLETRIAILQKKCANKGYNVSTHVLAFIAEKIYSNVREMEGVLNRIVSYATLVGGDCNDMDIVNGALCDYADNSKDMISIEQIVTATCAYFCVSKEDIIGKKKTKEVVVPRQICIYLICDILGQSLPLLKIGEYFGGRDHTTVMHARDKISEEIKTNATVAANVKDIKDKVFNR